MKVNPRAWQVEALEAWNRVGRRGVAQVVTGAGKTVFAELCIDQFLESVTQGRVFVIVPTLALLDQWMVSLREDLGIAETDIKSFSGRGWSQAPGPVNVMVINTARTALGTLRGDVPGMLVVDEVHRAGSPANAVSLVGQWDATLGISATPDRDFDAGFEELIVPALGSPFFTYDYARARADGVIAAFDLVNVEISLTTDERGEYEVLTRRVRRLQKAASEGLDVGGAIEVALRKRAGVSALARNRVPAAVKLIESHPGTRAIVFHERIARATEIRDILAARGRRVTIYHSQIGEALRQDNLKLYRQGAYDTLVTCRALDEGINVPETEVAVVAAATASTRQRIQRLGRVLRPAAGKESAIVYTVFATEAERDRLLRETPTSMGATSISWAKVERRRV